MGVKDEFDTSEIAWKTYEILYDDNYPNGFKFVKSGRKKLSAPFLNHGTNIDIFMSGDTDINLTDGFAHSRGECYRKLLNDITDERLKKIFKNNFAIFEELVYSVVNISLMPTTGNMQGVKEGLGNDRLDTFVWALNEYYEPKSENKTNLLLNRSSYDNLESLISFLDSFKDVYDYCETIYHINESLVDDLVESGKKALSSPERILEYMNLIFRFWTQKLRYLKENDKNGILREQLQEIENLLDRLFGEKLTYRDVVEKAKETVKRRGHYGTDDVDLYACDLWLKGDQINLWAYWQGYQINDIDKGIDIMLVGQDWGNPDLDKEVSERIKRMQAGERISYWSEKLSPTDTNLTVLFKELGCDVTSDKPGKRILFTNYCLGYRTGQQSRGMTPCYLDMDRELFDDLVKAVHPHIIICLGKMTYEAVTGEKTHGFVEQLKEGIPFVSEYSGVAGTKVFGVAHCGGLGLKNIGGIEKAKLVWKKIAEER